MNCVYSLLRQLQDFGTLLRSKRETTLKHVAGKGTQIS